MRLLLCIFGVAVSGIAAGDVIEQTTSFTLGPVNDRTVTFDQFDESLGTLTEVRLEVTAVLSASVSLQNTTNSGRFANTRVFGWIEYDGPTFSATGPDALGIDSREFEMLDGFFVAANDIVNDRNIGNQTINPLPSRPGPTSVYVGTGTFGVTFDYQVGTEITPPGVFSAAFEFNGFTIASLFYEFDPIPTPGTAGVLAFAGLVMVRRRR
ncbi:MAG: choice-of-anchor E domain-containing protein [Planctomycetota bacterium]